MTMDLTQTSQMLKWLDEERRKDKATIAMLQERLGGQAEQLGQQGEQLVTLQKTVAGLELLMDRITEFTQTVENVKVEVAQMLDQRDEQRRKEQRESERSRQLEVGALRDEISQVGEHVRPVPRLEESLGVVQAEERRLNEGIQRLEAAVTDLDKRVEGRLQTVVYLEEQRRADHQRITGLEKDLPELRKRLEVFGTKLPLLEESIQKQQARLEEGLKPIKEFEKVVEELRVADFRRNQDVKKWSDQADKIRAEIERLREERQRFLGDYRDIQEVLKRLETFQTRLETRQNEVAEMQRLAEDRVKRQWEEWQTAQEKNRRKWEVTSEELWRQQTQTNERYEKRLDAVPPILKLQQSQLDALWDSQRAEASRLLERAQDEYEILTTETEQRLTELREQSLKEL